MDTQLEMLDSLMVPLSIDHFSDGSQLPSDVYFRIHANKYIPVGKRGQASHFQDLHLFKDKIKDKRQQIVYLRKSELKDFVNMCLLSFQKIEAEAGDLDLKVKFLTQSSDLVSKQFEFLGVNSETIESAKVLTKSIQEVARQSHSVIELLHRFKDLPGNRGSQALCVSTVSAMIAIELGWASDSLLEKISIGGLLHDIGLQNFPESLLQKPYLDLTSQERALYETHPYVGAQSPTNRARNSS
jgi:HD-GYP domain-containing protein (c-di-GMP phosphodiesterase class II)